jgi:hypothetical protein
MAKVMEMKKRVGRKSTPIFHFGGEGYSTVRHMVNT